MRIHAFDAARSILLTLGIAYHALVFVFLYVEPAGLAEFLSVVFLHQLLHSFRMPAFFIVAGFFAMFLIDRRGRGAFLKHRILRIGLPFLIFWPLVVIANSWAVAWKFPSWSDVFPTSDTQHLWFLYFLMLFSFISWLSEPLLSRMATIHKKFPISLVMVALAALTPFIPGVIEREIKTSTHLLFHPGVFLFYFLCYCLGLVFFMQRERLLSLVADRSPLYMAIGLVGFVVFFVSQDWGVWFSSFAYSFALWFLAVGVLGVFLKVAGNEHRAIRYISDSSYWLYLIHLPLIFVFLRIGSIAELPASLIVVLAIGSTLAIGLGSYQLLVRHTFLGQLLNGTRQKASHSAA